MDARDVFDTLERISAIARRLAVQLDAFHLHVPEADGSALSEAGGAGEVTALLSLRAAAEDPLQLLHARLANLVDLHDLTRLGAEQAPRMRAVA